MRRLVVIARPTRSHRAVERLDPRPLVAFTAFVTLVSAEHDLNMQCKVKFRPVAIDTNDANGGIARTSFLYVEVEADKKFTVEPRICPEGYVPPTKTYQIQTLLQP